MKKLLFLLAFLPALAVAQIEKQDSLLGVMPEIDGMVHYQGIVKVDSVNQNTLYSRAKLFLTEVLGSDNNIIDMKDEASGTIVGKGYQIAPLPFANAFFTFKIQVRDNRYKYDIYDIHIITKPIYFGSVVIPKKEYPIEDIVIENSKNKTVKKSLAVIDLRFTVLINELKSYMQTNKQENNW